MQKWRHKFHIYFSLIWLWQVWIQLRLIEKTSHKGPNNYLVTDGNLHLITRAVPIWKLWRFIDNVDFETLDQHSIAAQICYVYMSIHCVKVCLAVHLKLDKDRVHQHFVYYTLFRIRLQQWLCRIVSCVIQTVPTCMALIQKQNVQYGQNKFSFLLATRREAWTCVN